MAANTLRNDASLATLTSDAIDTIQSLRSLLHEIKGKKTVLKDLENELLALLKVLWILLETVTTRVDFPHLREIVQSCEQECARFQQILLACSVKAEGSMTRIVDVGGLTWSSQEIARLREKLATYKGTISLILDEATFRNTEMTFEMLDDFRTSAITTISDLKDVIQDTEIKSEKENHEEFPSLNHQTLLSKEKAKLERCLDFCVDISDKIDNIRATLLAESSTSERDVDLLKPSSEDHMFEFLNLVGKQTVGMMSLFQLRQKSIGTALAASDTRNPTLNHSKQPSKRKLEDEENDIQAKKCLKICEQVLHRIEEGYNSFNNVSAVGNAQQMIVSHKNPLRAFNVNADSGSKQMIGQMCDASIQTFQWS